jgi:hypothetical protein
MIGEIVRRFLRRLVDTDARLPSLFVVVALLFLPSATAQSNLPRFERGNCLIPQPEGVRVDCGHVIAAESRARSNGRRPPPRASICARHFDGTLRR